MRTIESPKNARVKELRAGLKQGRTKSGLIAIEGEHLLKEALRSGLTVQTIFVRRGMERRLEAILSGQVPSEGTEVLLLESDLFRSASATENPQGLAALLKPPEFSLSAAFEGTPLLLVAAGIQNPGNLGTLVRSAEAFGATGVLLLPGTVSLWNAKTLRASSGSAFRLPSFAISEEEAIELLRRHGVRLFAATPHGGSHSPDLAQPAAILLGNEGAGLPEHWLLRADQTVTIPCPGAVESLNAAVAGSVLLYEAARQRLQKPAGPRQRIKDRANPKSGESGNGARR